MYIPMPPKFHAFKLRIAGFAQELGLRLSEDEALDLASHLYCDDFARLTTNPPGDWHCIRWNQDAAGADEIYNLVDGQSETLAVVMSQARERELELGEVVRSGDGLVVYADGDVYASIERISYENASAAVVRRFETLIAPLCIADEMGLLRKLLTLPAWVVEVKNDAALWSDKIFPVDSPRSGEYLPRLSFTHGSGASRPAEAETDAETDSSERIAAQQRAVEKNRLPMWVTPQSLAKLLQKLLEELTGDLPKLSRCQEALAKGYGARSWQALVARFKNENVPLVSLRTSSNDSEKFLRFYRTPIELLACIYEEAESQRAVPDQRIHIGAGWLDGRTLSVSYRKRGTKEIRDEIAATAGPSPQDIGWGKNGYADAEEKWALAELTLRAQSGEWKTSHWGLTNVLCADADLIDAAQKWLGRAAAAA